MILYQSKNFKVKAVLLLTSCELQNAIIETKVKKIKKRRANIVKIEYTLNMPRRQLFLLDELRSLKAMSRFNLV